MAMAIAAMATIACIGAAATGTSSVGHGSANAATPSSLGSLQCVCFVTRSSRPLPGLSWSTVLREVSGEVGISQGCSGQWYGHLNRIVVKASSTATAGAEDFQVIVTPTRGIEGQKTGTSGLRKRVKVFQETNYLANWVQSLFYSLPTEDVEGGTLVLGGDGRYFNKEAAQIIIKIAAGNGVAKILVGRQCAENHGQMLLILSMKRTLKGRNGILSTPASSAVIRRHKANGGFIMTASHNMGGPKHDWGIKFNYKSGQPAPESITDKIYGHTLSITEIKTATIPDVDLSELGTFKYGNFTVEVIDPVTDYLDLLKSVFDFDLLKSLLTRPDFRFKFDAMYAVTAAYAKPIFVDALGAPESSIANGKPLEDFGGLHPDPNLTYAAQLVKTMYGPNAPDFGAASDGDGDRNMIMGNRFFVTPSDSVAIIASSAQSAIPYFKNGLKGLARSMPTSGALDRVAKKLQLPFFEVPTGWKYFGNLMDAGKLSVCGEESFGTGSDHIREKDGIWAVLAWLSIIAHRNCDKKVGEKLVSVEDITKEHWDAYGRNYFTRYDYEDCEPRSATYMLEQLRKLATNSKPGDKFGDFTLQYSDDFQYIDPVDQSVASKQGVRFVFKDGSRIIFRLSGTGSAGATVRVYTEKYESDKAKLQLDSQVALKPLIEVALKISDLQEFTGMDKPTVIT